MVDAVGGVEVCLPEAIDDKKALLHLAAGRQTLNGEQALGYVRARYSLGDGSDIGRIQRQQMFIASMVKKVMSGETLTDPGQALRLPRRGHQVRHHRPRPHPRRHEGPGLSPQGLNAGQIHFITTPWHYSLTQPGRVEWVQPQAGRLFQIVATDDEPAGRQGRADQGAQIEDAGRAAQRHLPRPVSARRWPPRWSSAGYHITKIGDTPRKPYRKTTILYGPNGETGVPTLTKDLLASNAQAGRARRRPRRLVLVIGDDWKGIKALATERHRRR